MANNMNRVLAAIDNSLAARPVLGMAVALAPVLGARVEAVTVGDGDTMLKQAESLGVSLTELCGDPLAAIAALASGDDVVALVVGARNRMGGPHEVGHLALALANLADKPVLLVPPEVVAPPGLHRVMVAIKGTPDRMRPLRRAVAVMNNSELELVAVHVEDENSIPSFSDQPQYEVDAYAEEFLARHVPGAPRARAQLRFGDPVEEVLEASREERSELLAVGWTQGNRPGRGRVSRALAARSPVPLLLVPLANIS